MAAALPGIVVPLAVVGLGLLLLSGGRSQATLPARASSRVALTLLSTGQQVPVYVEPSQVVAFFPRASNGTVGTWMRLIHPMAPSEPCESIKIEETPDQVVAALSGHPSDFICVHMMIERPDPGWRGRDDLEDGPSTEVLPLYINRAHIEAVGPSSVLHWGGRTLGRIYTTDGCAFEVHESLDTLRRLVGAGVPQWS